VPVTKKGVYFAFRDQGACLSVIAIKIFYITCPNITTNFAFYPETPTGKELTTIVETDGVCVANSQQVEIPRLLCKGDGNWTLPSGGCKCVPGYEPVGQSCQGKLSSVTSQLGIAQFAFASNCSICVRRTSALVRRPVMMTIHWPINHARYPRCWCAISTSSCCRLPI